MIPNPRSPSYPSEHAAIAGAASAVLSYLYPTEQAAWEGLADEDGQSRLLAGVEYPSDVAAGLALDSGSGVITGTATGGSNDSTVDIRVTRRGVTFVLPVRIIVGA